MKGGFKYKNNKFKYKFSVIEWDNCRGWGAGRIDYKDKWYRNPKIVYINKNRRYENLLYYCEKMDRLTLQEEIKKAIIEDYEYQSLKNKWK